MATCPSRTGDTRGPARGGVGAAGISAVGAAGSAVAPRGGHGVVGSVRHRGGAGGRGGVAKAPLPAKIAAEKNGFAMPPVVGVRGFGVSLLS